MTQQHNPPHPLNITNDTFLDRFLSDINNQLPPCLEDLTLIAGALIQMHDYGVSFKTAFRLADNRGRKPKTSKNAPITDDFQSMAKGFLGNPLFLNSFLSKIAQGQQPEKQDMERVANALIKMRDDGESLKSAFGILKKTGHKELSSLQVPLGEITTNEKWMVYYAYQKHRKTKTHSEACEQVSETVRLKKQVKGGGRNRQYKPRQIENIVKETKLVFDIYAAPIKIQWQKKWNLYFSSRKHIRNNGILEAIQLIGADANGDYWKVCTALASLYEEVTINNKYSLITRGTQAYPVRLTKRLETELRPVYELVESVYAISPINGFLIQRLYEIQLEKNAREAAIEHISQQLCIEPLVINAYLKSLGRSY